MQSAEIRNRFLHFFERQGHTIVPSSSLVPHNDPTLLFTNSGMVQFKDVFLGTDKRDYVRATSSQRSVRAGGKHNDLDNVGYTARHHTFFEMLGNFSFGDYFKREAIYFAWRFLTQELGLDTNKLWVTVYHDDHEAADIWLNEIKLVSDRLIRIDSSDNFWQMGDTGPCGPCSEIFYDHGPDVPGGLPGSLEADGDRYIEIWNLVFMQYNRDEHGVLHTLPKPSVDTGMGLERIAAIMQGVHSNYEIDLFVALINDVARLTHCSDRSRASLRVIADHIRSSAFLIVDGVIPSHEGRGYVLRRIIRRAIRHGYQLGNKTPFFYQLVDSLVQQMGQAYPELVQKKEMVASVLLQEEKRFSETLEKGMIILEEAFVQGHGVLSGATIFRLYDTYGFPADLTADVARERGVGMDWAGFELSMEQQRERARRHSRFSAGGMVIYEGKDSEFVGYQQLSTPATVLALYFDGSSVSQLDQGQTGVVVLNKTPFYAESGGQVGDVGQLSGVAGTFTVQDTQKISAQVYGHHGLVKLGSLAVGDLIEASVDIEVRVAAARHHSATHLLHAALRDLLGSHVTQQGSLVTSERLRFDFSHGMPVTEDQLQTLEFRINQELLSNVSVTTEQTSYDQAIEKGAMALFGEKYGSEVRVVEMGEFSTELCGGTHVQKLGELGLFKIIGETAVSAGVRRIEAVAGLAAYQWVQELNAQQYRLSQQLKSSVMDIEGRVSQLLQKNQFQEQQIIFYQGYWSKTVALGLIQEAKNVGSLRIVVAEVAGGSPKLLKEIYDFGRSDSSVGMWLLATVQDQKVSLLAAVAPAWNTQIPAGELVNQVAKQVGGKGGGRAELAQAGGVDPASLPQALSAVIPWVKKRLSIS